MKRYKLNTTVDYCHDVSYPWIEKRKIQTVMEESSNGDWVQWSDVEKLKEYYECQIPEYRIAKLEKALGLVTEGKCPECKQYVKGYKSPTGHCLAPELFQTMREHGIDPCTGHKFGCSIPKIKL